MTFDNSILEGFNMKDLVFMNENIQSIFKEEKNKSKDLILTLTKNLNFSELLSYLKENFIQEENCFSSDYSDLKIYFIKNDDWEMIQIFEDHILILEKVKSMKNS